MKKSAPALLLFCLFLLAAGLYYLESDLSRPKSAPKASRIPVASFDTTNVKKIAATNGGLLVEIVQRDDQWWFEKPFQDVADTDAIHIWLEDLRRLKGWPTTLPLTPPQLTIPLTLINADDDMLTVNLYYLGSDIFFKMHERVWRLDRTSERAFSIQLQQFRKHPFKNISSNWKALSFKSKSYRSFSIKKQDDGWYDMASASEPARLITEKVDRWRKGLEELMIQEFIDDKELLKNLTLQGEELGVYTVSSNGDSTRISIFRVKVKDKLQFLLTLSDRPSHGFLIDTSFASRIISNPFQFRDQASPFSLDWENMQWFSLTDQKGTMKIFKSASGQWTSDYPSIQWAPLVKRYQEKLSGLEAKVFFNDASKFKAGPEKLTLQFQKKNSPKVTWDFGAEFKDKTLWPGTETYIKVKNENGDIFGVRENILPGLRRAHLTP